MGDLDGDGNDSGPSDLVLAAEGVVRALASRKKLSREERRVLADLGAQLSMIGLESDEDEESAGAGDEEVRLSVVGEKIVQWESVGSMIWDTGAEEIGDYLDAVYETRRLIEILEDSSFDVSGQRNEMLRRAHDVMQTAMTRLEDEFKHILLQSKRTVEPEPTSFRSSEDDALEVGSPSPVSSFEDSHPRDSMSRASRDCVIDLVHPDAVRELRSISKAMFASGYGKECSQMYMSVRRDALDEILFVLELERQSIEDVLRMEWDLLNSKIRTWSRVIRVFVQIYLASERWLYDQIFGETMVDSSCFVEASKAAVFQLLTFGKAIYISPHEPHKLHSILRMYETMSDLFSIIEELYGSAAGSSVRNEYGEVQNGLGDSVKLTFLEFRRAIMLDRSTTPFPGGGVHHVTRYVINYIMSLMDYGETLETLLEYDGPGEFSPSSSPKLGSPRENDISKCPRLSPHFHRIASILQDNLNEKSALYHDAALQHFFLMNNINYMAEKVSHSDLRPVFGGEWIRRQKRKSQHYAMNYEKSTLSSVLPLLKEEVSGSGSGSGRVLSAAGKEALRKFYAAFEEIHKTQMTWSIPDVNLRGELRASVALKVVQAYQAFVGRHSNNHLNERYIKYNVEELENLLMDLFEGPQKSPSSVHRR
ncbi:hypothetical protein MLD38_001289 [Melastoma candidum]|uniref:Uncharacterized protein n=1 Tax=Melastoma candidum TaxID=119954 RepID=A0ACB9SER4_9MYRT|nr:hypothetical protein MLD38_001289 [Melastoma candidum]